MRRRWTGRRSSERTGGDGGARVRMNRSGDRRRGAPAWEPAPLGRWLAFLLVAGFLAGCGTDPTGPPEPIDELPRELTAAERELAAAGNEFGFGLLGRVEAEEPEDNIFLSPLSASMALGMALVGSDGDTFEAMRTTLGFPGLSRDDIARSYGDLTGLLRGLDPAVEVGIGNSVWIREGFPFLEEYLDVVERHFDGRASELDFSDPEAAETINGWVRERTGDRIEELVTPPIDPNVVAYLINAIYFDGRWTEPFDPEETSEAPFTRPDGGTTPVRMMSRRDTIAYAETDSFRVVELPYGGEAYSMTLLLPDPDVSVDRLAASLDTAAWRGLLDGLDGRDVRLSLPRFELEYEKVLNDVLKAMGMEGAFSGSADFTRMVEGGGIWIDEVKQKSFVRVDEEGTEAAAATSVAMVESAPPEVRFDRPFLFALRERLSGAILFLGKIVDPPPIPAE